VRARVVDAGTFALERRARDRREEVSPIDPTAESMRGRRVLVIGTFDPATPRTRQWLRLLDRLECDVEVRNISSWDADRASQTARSPLVMLPRVAAGLLRLAWHLMRCERPDLVVFLYPGHLDACILGPIARLRRVPAVLDIFLSLYDTVVSDRGLRSPRSPVGIATRAVDIAACWSVPMVVVDTPENADFLARFTHRGRKHFAVLWVGADESIYGPPAADPGDDAPILWYLTYIPLHGVETVAYAAALLRDDGRRIRLVGDGQERPAAERLIAELGLQNVDVVGAVPETELVDEIARASICLGVFGTTEKAARVVPNKVYQCAAAGRAIVTAATPANSTAFGAALVTIPPGDAPALAEAIRGLRGPARIAAGERARRTFVERFSEAALARDLAQLLGNLVRPTRR
jgi:glycosyltransferase involved in cell wall biosynthesis